MDVYEATPMGVGISSIGRFHMFDLARQMLRLGQRMTLFTGYPLLKVDKDLRHFTRTHSIGVLIQQLRRRFGPAPKTTWWEDRSLEDFGRWLGRRITIDAPDILDALAGTGLEAGRLLRRAGKVWICNRGSTHILTQKRMLAEEHARWGLPAPCFSPEGLDRALAEYHEADAIVVPSEFARRSFIEHGLPADRVFKNLYGVDLSLFRHDPSRPPNRRLRVVYLGTSSIRKGIGYLLEALQPLVKHGAVETWLIGSVTGEARRILQAHDGEFVHQGVQPRAALSSFLSRCDVLVLPSIEEGLALVLAQAMACGVPVIATTNTGAEDLFEDGKEGFIIPTRDPQAIRARVEWMLDRPVERQEMGGAAVKRVKALGGWDSYGRRAVAIYREIIVKKGIACERVSH